MGMIRKRRKGWVLYRVVKKSRRAGVGKVQAGRACGFMIFCIL